MIAKPSPPVQTRAPADEQRTPPETIRLKQTPAPFKGPPPPSPPSPLPQRGEGGRMAGRRKFTDISKHVKGEKKK